MIKKITILLLLTLNSSSFAQFEQLRHVIQINTHLKYIEGKPTWLLVIRDMKSGRILPYLYDFNDPDNYWIAFSTERAYRIINSSVKFGPHVVIHNFCGLENGVLDGKSMTITLSGALTPCRFTSACRVLKYSDIGFTIVDPQ